MSEVFLEFDNTIVSPDAQPFTARACGREARGGKWEGWIEFVPLAGGDTLRTPRETTQPNRENLAYWATGLTEAYLEGALKRALAPDVPIRRAPAPKSPHFDGPAEPGAAHVKDTAETPSPPPGGPPRAVLDPFAVYAQGEDILRQELEALDDGHLRNIILAHDLAGSAAPDLRVTPRRVLLEMIMAGAKAGRR